MATKMNNTMRQVVETICQELSVLYDNMGQDGFNWRAHNAAEKAVFSRLTKIDEDLKKHGFVPGRIAYISHADGYAIYVVGDIGPQFTEMLHVKYSDAWESPVVCEGKAMTKTVRSLVKSSDKMDALFANK